MAFVYNYFISGVICRTSLFAFTTKRMLQKET